MKITFTLFFLINIICSINGQALWNKRIDDAQKVLCKKDSVTFKCITTISNNADINLLATAQVVNKVDYWQKYINSNASFNNNEKQKYLRILLSFLTKYNYEGRKKRKDKEFVPTVAKELFNDFGDIIEAIQQKKSIANAISNKGSFSSKLILTNEYAKEMLGLQDGWDLYYYKEAVAKPETIMSVLEKRPNLPSADSLLIIAAYNNQDKVYDYAQCVKCKVYPIIERSQNGLVKTIYQMAQMETGRSLTPFLDAISRGEVTIDEINVIQANPHQYFKLLVNTRLKYLARMEQGESIIAYDNFNEKFEEKALGYVKEINELHTQSDNVRFAILNPLNAQELYYLAVLGLNELYTSSFNRGVFQQMINKLNGITTDSLLTSVKSDYFRKFIKISAGYNKLSQFLKLMPEIKAQQLMSNFVTGLADDANLENIEDAVDVADAFVGIGLNKELATVSNLIMSKSLEYENYFTQMENTKGQNVYRLLNLLFKSYKDTSLDISMQLGLKPINKVAYNDLAAGKNKVVVKLYFYGDEDKDGQYSYQNFMGLFGDKTKWSIKAIQKVKGSTDYVEINSLKGTPVQIFANYPHYDATKKTDPDDTAKYRMSEYMINQNIVPTFVMHRGHSYHVPITLQYMENYDTAAKLIVLGSCGGYQNLQKVLDICPEAQVVTSKQTGTMHVNDPMLRELFLDLGASKDVVWPSIWPRIRKRIDGSKMEMFEEYISPEKNLGMIFYKAYKKQLGS